MARTINSSFPKEFRWSPFLSDDGKNKVREIPLPLFKKKKTKKLTTALGRMLD